MRRSLANLQRSFARALAEPGAAIPLGIGGTDAAAARRRFAIYRNNVAVSLIDALADSFPVTVALVGAEFFSAMARAYSAMYRPRSPVLLHYGTDFPDFIETFEPARTLPYLPDVARLEAAWISAYHAADCYPCPLSVLVALGDSAAEARVKFLPSMVFVRSEFPVGSIWRSHQSGEEQSPPEWIAESVMVFRPAMQVEAGIFTGAKRAFVSKLVDYCTIAEAASAAILVDGKFDSGGALLELLKAESVEEFQLRDDR
jgi:hypothetical protein